MLDDGLPGDYRLGRRVIVCDLPDDRYLLGRAELDDPVGVLLVDVILVDAYLPGNQYTIP